MASCEQLTKVGNHVHPRDRFSCGNRIVALSVPTNFPCNFNIWSAKQLSIIFARLIILPNFWAMRQGGRGEGLLPDTRSYSVSPR